MQWYIDNIKNLHTAQPTRNDLVFFFIGLDASRFGGSFVLLLLCRSSLFDSFVALSLLPHQLEWRILLLDHASVHSHSHTLTHSHTILVTCTCCYDLTKGTQDKDFSYSFFDSLFFLFVVMM